MLRTTRSSDHTMLRTTCYAHHLCPLPPPSSPLSLSPPLLSPSSFKVSVISMFASALFYADVRANLNDVLAFQRVGVRSLFSTPTSTSSRLVPPQLADSPMPARMSSREPPWLGCSATPRWGCRRMPRLQPSDVLPRAGTLLASVLYADFRSVFFFDVF